VSLTALRALAVTAARTAGALVGDHADGSGNRGVRPALWLNLYFEIFKSTGKEPQYLSRKSSGRIISGQPILTLKKSLCC
jgi:hypothetical protein